MAWWLSGLGCAAATAAALGTEQVTMVPPVGPGSIANDPPIIAARCAMIRMPRPSVFRARLRHPRPVVLDCQRHKAAAFRQGDADALGFAVLDSIADSFLCDAEEVRRRGIVVNQHRRVALEHAADLSRIRDVGGQVPEGNHQTLGFHLHRIKPAGQVARQRDSLLDQLDHFAGVGGFRQRLGGEAFAQYLPSQGRAREVLAEAVMQLVSDPALFPLANPQNLLLQPLTFRHLLRQSLRPLAHGGFQLPVE